MAHLRRYDRQSPETEFVEPRWRHRWNRVRASAAAAELFNLIHRFHWDEWSHGFQILTCTVDMAGYKSARAANPLLRPAEAICVNTCVGRLGLHEPAARIRLCFDRNEAFMRQVEQVWSKDRKKPNVRWARQVEEIAPGDARSTPGLQAADLLAWHVNRGWATADIPMLLRINGIVCRRYDKEGIARAYPPERERRRIEGIDRAKRKTSEAQPRAERAMDT